MFSKYFAQNLIRYDYIQIIGKLFQRKIDGNESVPGESTYITQQSHSPEIEQIRGMRKSGCSSTKRSKYR